jgi:hypothetical protein
LEVKSIQDGSSSSFSGRYAAHPAGGVDDGAFVAHHIDPRETDIRGIFDLLRRALTALARELVETPAPRKK